MKRIPLLTTVLLGGALVACGSLEGNTTKTPTLATIRGELTNPSSVAIDGAVRVAVVWRSVTPGSFNVAQDLPVQPQFPAAFSIALDGPPPAEVMRDDDPLVGGVGGSSSGGGSGSGSSSGSSSGGSSSGAGSSGGTGGGSSSGAGSSSSGAGSSSSGAGSPSSSGAGSSGSATPAPSAPAAATNDFRLAIGSVVAYVDENGNGKLDLVPDGASGYIDRIAATNDHLVVVYIEGNAANPALTQGATGTPAAGYNLYTLCSDEVPLPPSSGSRCATAADAGPTTCTPSWSAIDTKITLPVANGPHVNALMCLTSDNANAGSGSGSSGGATNQPTTYPDPCDPHVYCADDGSWYSFQTCTVTERGICEGTDTFCETDFYDRPTPTPAGWPCK